MRARRRAVIVLDLGFGDAGKGLVTDFLVRRLEAHTVVRFNGGAQAGHNVVTPEGRHHTFSQIGAGAFVPGTATFLARDVAVHPTAMLVEAERLEAIGVSRPLALVTVSADARVVTPFHQAAGRLRELARGAHGHGTCGVGVGEVRLDASAGLEEVRVQHLLDVPRLRRMLVRLQEAKRTEIGIATRDLTGEVAHRERQVLEEPSVIDSWLTRVAEWTQRASIAEEARLRRVLDRPGAVVFEGAQGVLLDEVHGFHPYTTWSDCTPRGALSLLAEHAYSGETIRLGVLRALSVRHGPGPFPTEDVALSKQWQERHNQNGPWQGPVRVGWPDAILCDYAVHACRGVDALAITHLDRAEALDAFRCSDRYLLQGAEPELFRVDEQLQVRAMVPPERTDLERQSALTRALAEVQPLFRPLEVSAIVDAFSEWCRAPVRLCSRGPTAGDVRTVGFDATQ